MAEIDYNYDITDCVYMDLNLLGLTIFKHFILAEYFKQNIEKTLQCGQTSEEKVALIEELLKCTK